MPMISAEHQTWTGQIVHIMHAARWVSHLVAYSDVCSTNAADLGFHPDLKESPVVHQCSRDVSNVLSEVACNRHLSREFNAGPTV